MLFNSEAFLLFFALFFPVYWLLHRRILARNCWILAGSYLFYGSWDWRFLSLIALSTLIDFVCGQKIEQAQTLSHKRLYLALSMCSNLGILATFKYFGFFVSSFVDLMQALGIELNFATLSIVLPVGISFYTFQTMSYTIDIYRSELKPTRNFINFAAFVAFFPQLVAGPIERARQLLPQIEGTVQFRLAQLSEGAWLILWGLVKKVLIADRLAVYVDSVYASPEDYSSATIATAMVFFAIQIYCDFSGYSDIARGIAKLLGMELMVNFDTPYFATSLKAFWRRWHISLSTWFRDYVFIPLGGSKGGDAKTRRNVMITFVTSGLWHGAAYTFLIWGFLHALGMLLDPFSRGKVPRFRWLNALLGWLSTFLFVNIAWVFFRADNLAQALAIIGKAFSPLAWLNAPTGQAFWTSPGMSNTEFSAALLMITTLVLTDWCIRGRGIDKVMTQAPRVVSWAYSWLLISFFILLAPSDSGAFIYFQF